MKTLNNLLRVFTIIILTFSSINVFSQTNYLNNPVQVPYFRGDIVDHTTIDLDWDLSEINNDNSRLDLVVGVSQKDVSPTLLNYANGNWYFNQYDTNFNYENSNTRFVYNTNYEQGFTGLVFSRLVESSGAKRYVVVTRENGGLYVYRNNNGSISQTELQKITNFQGSVQSSGKFTTDNIEDVAVLSNDSIKIYKGLGNGELDSIPVYKIGGGTGENTRLMLGQVSNYIDPYNIINNTTGDRDEIIMKQGTAIIIFKNDNNNGTSTYTIFNNLGYFVDFKLGDINNDGYNDLITAEQFHGIKIFLNIGGTIDTNVYYSNTNLGYINAIAVADFNKDGWNDFVCANDEYIHLILNAHGTFSQSPSFSLLYENFEIGFFPLIGTKLEAIDLHNLGGTSIIFSGFPAILNSSPLEQIYDREEMYRLNASTIDQVPAPPILFKSYVQKNGKTWPKLYLYNRGDRDFNKFRIFKKSPNRHDSTVFVAETSYNTYLDTTENIVVGETEPDSI